jgi:hypothetical protein
LWSLARQRLLSIERAWADPAARQRAISECRRWLEEQTSEPRLSGLARLLVPDRAWKRWCEARAVLRGEGVRVVALETVGGAPAADEFAWTFPCALLLGNERFGLEEETVRDADATVRVPVYGRKNSLNVVSAAAVAGYAARRAWDQRR